MHMHRQVGTGRGKGRDDSRDQGTGGYGGKITGRDKGNVKDRQRSKAAGNHISRNSRYVNSR